MARVLPFAAYTPPPELAANVASRSVEHYSKAQLAEIQTANLLSFLNIIKPAVEDEDKTNIRKRFFEGILKGQFKKVKKQCYFIYRQSIGDVSYDGIIALASVADYEAGKIKLHEQTLTHRENLLAEYLDKVNLNAEPVCFTFPRSLALESILIMVQRRKPYLDFEETDKTRHQVWMAHAEEELSLISDAFKELPAIYIADGHHRSASSVRLAQLRRNNLAHHHANSSSEFFMGIFFAENQLKIFEYNRLVKNIDGFSLKDLLKKLEINFQIIPHNKNPFEPMYNHEFGMYSEGQWYELNLKAKIQLGDNPVESLEPEVFNHYILAPCFNITDIKTDKRIGFLSGKTPLEELSKKVDSGKYQAAFTLFPVSEAELFAVADRGLTMPPKSTWVEPKLLSGLTVYDLGENG